MDDGIPDENNLRFVRAIELDHCGMAGLPIINGVIPVLGHTNPPSVPFSAGGQDGEFRRARPAIAIDLPQGREAEKPRVDRGERDLLERWIVPNVGECAGNDVGRPTGSIRAGFKAVILDCAVRVPVLSRKVGETGNLVRTAHVNRDGMRQPQILVPTSVPEGG